MSQFILARDRNCSSPVFPVASHSPPRAAASPMGGAGEEMRGEHGEGRLPRSPSVEDIPRELLFNIAPEATCASAPLHHSQSSTVSNRGQVNYNDQSLGLLHDPSTRSLDLIIEQLQAELGVEGRSHESGLNLTAEHIEFSPVSSPTLSPRQAASGLPEDYKGRQNGAMIEFLNPHSSNFNTTDGGKVPTQGRPLSGESEVSGAVVMTTGFSNGGHGFIRLEEMETEDGVKKKVKPGVAYYIGKELVMTERTYVKDLGIISVWFRNAVSRNEAALSGVAGTLLHFFDDFYERHSHFLKQIELRLSQWEALETKSMVVASEQCRIGDLLLAHLSLLPSYESYMSHLEQLLVGLDSACKGDPDMEQLYRDFEMQKVCYLPLNAFLLKPPQRLLHYQLILDKCLQHRPASHPDVRDCQEAVRLLSPAIRTFSSHMPRLDNIQKLLELQQDLTGVNNLFQSNREFVREGCLQKLSRKGYQQRMFFLFSDVLLYTSRVAATQSLLFRVHGQLPTAGMTIEELDQKKVAVGNSFAVYSGSRCLLVAASSEAEKAKWLEDLQRVITVATGPAGRSEKSVERSVLYPSLKSNSSSEAMYDGTDDPSNGSGSGVDRGQIPHRTNTLTHVCWHRNTSVSMRQRGTANTKLLSGFLMRKFKTNNDWQRLWVVFTNFCLFFYKSYRDEAPLTGLPLLGYSVQLPGPMDNIGEELVFKLQFKNHVYFFRAESSYTFERWLEVISAATGASHHMRLFSRLDSAATAPSPHH